MKKIFLALAVFALSFGMTGCGKSEPECNAATGDETVDGAEAPVDADADAGSEVN